MHLILRRRQCPQAIVVRWYPNLLRFLLSLPEAEVVSFSPGGLFIVVDVAHGFGRLRSSVQLDAYADRLTQTAIVLDIDHGDKQSTG